MKNNVLEISIPEGMEIDKENSTFERIVFKEKEKEKEVNTYSDLSLSHKDMFDDIFFAFTPDDNTIVKKITAKRKLYRLMEYYGGMPKDDNDLVYYIEYSNSDFKVSKAIYYRYVKNMLCFYSIAEAERFLLYPENKELLKDYYSITK